MKPCKYHTIGQYWHSTSELCNFCTVDEIDGLGDLYKFYKFCPDCGTKITAAIRKAQMKENA